MIRRFVSQSWGLLLIFAVWQVWVMASHYNSIVIVSPVAVMRDIAAASVDLPAACVVDTGLRAWPAWLQVCCWACCSPSAHGDRSYCRPPSALLRCC